MDSLSSAAVVGWGEPHGFGLLLRPTLSIRRSRGRHSLCTGAFFLLLGAAASNSSIIDAAPRVL